MDFQEENTEIPDWILRHLRKFGNCCCGREIVKKIGKEKTNVRYQFKKLSWKCI